MGNNKSKKVISVRNKNINIKKKLLKKNNNKKKILSKKKKISKTLKLQVWDKYVGLKKGSTKCFICEVQIIYQMTFEVGHKIAEIKESELPLCESNYYFTKGGERVIANINNLIPICSICNKSQETKEFKKEDCIKKNYFN